MHNLVVSLLAQLAPKAREQRTPIDELDGMIGRLKRQQHELEQRLSAASRGPQMRRLKIALQVARLQQKKAFALRARLSGR